MPQPITTKLTRAGLAVPAGPSIPIADDGTVLEVSVPPGLELSEANLLVQVPDDSAPIDLIAGSSCSTSTGGLAWPELTNLSWLSLDWRARRGLVRLALTLKAGSNVTHLRLRSSDGGPWMLAAPFALVPVSNNAASVQLAGLAASRLMLELVTKPGNPLSPEDYVPEPATITTLTLTGSRRPPALTVSLGPRTVVRHEPTLLPPAATLNLREPLLAALRTALPGRTGGAAQIVLRSPVLAALRRLELTLAARPEQDRFRDDRTSLSLELTPGRELVAFIDLAAHPTGFSARVRPDLRPELPPPVPTPTLPPPYAHRCGPDSALAQSFVFPAPALLVGVDLLLAARSQVLLGRITLHADNNGSPAEPPLATSKLDLTASTTPGLLTPPRWHSVDLPAPVSLPAGAPVWLVLTLDRGEALWALDLRQGDTPARALLRRDRAADWIPRDMTFPTGPQILWALARPRLRNDGPPLTPELLLRRGDQTLALVADPAGRVRADATALAPLNLVAPATPLELVIRSPSAGRVELDDLHVELPALTTTWSFGSPP